jgi:hypothetical protein
MNSFGKRAANQPIQVKGLDRNQVILAHKARADLVKIVITLPRDGSMAPSDGMPSLSVTVRARAFPRKRALRHPQPAFGKARSPKAGNRRSIGKRSKGRYAQIYADESLAVPQRRGWKIQIEHNDPPLHVPPEAATSDTGIRQGSMEMYSQRTRHAFEPKPAIFQRDPDELNESKTIESALAAKPWKSRLESLR